MRSILFLICLFLLLPYACHVQAATYYVKNGGNDSASGQSHANAWATIGKVNSYGSFLAGDDVYFLCDDAWSGQVLDIDWNGSSSNQAVVGAYWMNGGTETIVTSTGCPAGQSKPEIAGGFTSDTASGNVPSSRSAGLVYIDANYVTVQDLRVINSSGFSIEIYKFHNNNIVQRNEIDRNFDGGIFANYGSSLNTVQDNVITNSTLGQSLGLYSDHSGCIFFSNSTQNIIQNNTITIGGCEGILFYNSSNKNIAVDNVVVGAKHLGVYLDNVQDNLIERNLIVGDSNGYKGLFDETNVGIGSTMENHYGTLINNSNNIIRNNLIANVERCFTSGVWDGNPNTNQFKFIFNTCVGSDDAIIMYNGAAKYAAGTEIANNIFYEIRDGAAGASCYSSANIDFHNNHCDQTPTPARQIRRRTAVIFDRGFHIRQSR